MKQLTHTLTIATNGPGLYEITGEVLGWCQRHNTEEGLLTLFMRHTSASLTIQENADPDVRFDLQEYFSRLVPQDGSYRHSAEGPDDMPAHIKSALTEVQLTIPVQNGRPALGTWQGIYVFEHRHQRHRRQVAMHFLGRCGEYM